MLLNVQLCVCEALPPYPPTYVVVEPVSSNVLSVAWRAPDQSNGRAPLLGGIIIKL
jgi:hypothetical protein